MTNDEAMKAVMTISVDRNLSVNINFGGREELLLGMLGALEYTKRWVAERIAERLKSIQGWSDEKTVPEHLTQEYAAEHKVTRDEALRAYEYAIQAMKMRVDVIAKAPEAATFAVDLNLLSKL